MLDELGNGSAVVGGEDADEIDSTVQVIDIDGVQLLGLSVAAHDLTTAQVVNHDLLYRFGTLHIKHARGGENDVVHPSTVAAADDTRVLLVAEFEGVRAEIDREGGLRPAGGTRLAVHLGVVNVEFEEVISVLRRDFAEIGDACM